MRVELLSGSAAAELARQELTCPASVHTADPPPPGYGRFARSRALPRRKTFAQLRDELMTWQVQARSGLHVAASSPRVEPDAVVVMWVGLGRASLRIPCRVVAVHDEVDRVGFAYGTLPGHPESGGGGRSSCCAVTRTAAPSSRSPRALDRPARWPASVGPSPDGCSAG